MNFTLQWKGTVVVLVYLSHVPSYDKRYSTSGHNRYIIRRLSWLLTVFAEVLHMAMLCGGSITFSMLNCVFSLISHLRQNSISYACRSNVSLAVARMSEGTICDSLTEGCSVRRKISMVFCFSFKLCIITLRENGLGV